MKVIVRMDRERKKEKAFSVYKTYKYPTAPSVAAVAAATATVIVTTAAEISSRRSGEPERAQRVLVSFASPLLTKPNPNFQLSLFSIVPLSRLVPLSGWTSACDTHLCKAREKERER